MSHFLCVVMVPKSTKNIEKSVEKLLAPYSENLEVAPYEKACYCIGHEARAAARQKAEAVAGAIDTFREKYHALPEGQRPAWKAFIHPLIAAEQQYEKEHPSFDKPDAKCDECHGSGVRKDVTYNPESKWDWWTIGGRWTGALVKDYDPEKDPSNQEICFLCEGSGDRPGWVTYRIHEGTKIREFKDDWSKQMNGCNGCQGTGQTVKFPTQWKKFKDDVRPVRLLEPDCIPFAILTPDGAWHQRADMGWWGMTSNEMDETIWEKEVRALYQTHHEAIAVAVDCHI